MNNVRYRFMALIGLIVLALTQMPVEASGVVVSLSDGVGTLDASDGGQQEIDTSFTTSDFYATGTTIIVTISPAATSTISDCSTPDTQFAQAADGSFGSFTSSTATYTLTTNASAGSLGSLCLSFGLTTSTPTNYSIAVLASGQSVDFGAALYYAVGGNLMNVTAAVPASLSFAIRNAADTADTNSCALGVLSPSAVSLCSYRLRIATNAGNGFSATILGDHDFAASNGYATMTTITNDAIFATGTEAYGMAFFNGAISGGRNTSTHAYTEGVVESNLADTTFITDSSPVPTSTETLLMTFPSAYRPGAAPSLTDTSLVVHGAAIDAGTAAGSYQQTVTYRVTGSY